VRGRQPHTVINPLERVSERGTDPNLSGMRRRRKKTTKRELRVLFQPHDERKRKERRRRDTSDNTEK